MPIATSKRTLMQAAAAAMIASVAFVVPATAQEYPTQPIQIVVPYSAGGGTDLVARAFASVANNYSDVPIRVVTMPGSGGARGAAYVSEAEPDGYTINLGTLGSHVSTPALQDAGYTPADFDPIAVLTAPTFVFVVQADSPFESLDDLMTYAQDNPGELRYGSSGAGGSAHLLTALFQRRFDVEFTHVPFNGSSEAVLNLIGGHVDFAVPSTGSATGPIENGDVRGIAQTGANRFAGLPEMPTMVEQGYDFTFSVWRGMLAPAGTPDVALDYLSDLAAQVSEDEEYIRVIERLEGTGPQYMDRAEFEELYQNEVDAVAEVAPDLAN